MIKILKIQIEAIKFLDEVKELSVKNIEYWLSKQGYTLHYFSESEAESLGVNETEKGFKRKSELLKIVYIKNNLSPKEQLETIIHEAGHVLFDDTSILKSTNYKELQANMFCEYVANPNKVLLLFYKLYKIKYKILVICLLLIGLIVFHNQSAYKPIETNNVTEANKPIKTTVKSEINSEETVYITPTGTKYHKENCFSIRNSNKTKTTIEKAKQSYAPCKLCNPNE